MKKSLQEGTINNKYDDAEQVRSVKVTDIRQCNERSQVHRSNPYDFQKLICNFHGWKGGRRLQKCPECLDLEERIRSKLKRTTGKSFIGIENIDSSCSIEGIRIWLKCNMGHKFACKLEDVSVGCQICSSEKFLSPTYKTNAAKLDSIREEAYRKKQGELLAAAKEIYVNRVLSKTSMGIEKDSLACIKMYPNLTYESAYAVMSVIAWKDDPFQIFGIPRDMSLGDKNSVLNHIKRFFRIKAKQIHPDKNCHPKSGEAFNILSNAYNEMLNYVEKRL
ncbi:DnaJ domain-containing protein [Cryptosporidium muris RN66]|uniref:DnaJ domain-containing protein n=1 Tax=Cryptosporidium muris (strain RN66) TaxID=441375 RepID=B6AEQ0_CRYMR|nr:DnaJ domain-containing protein [Cryptosporidium muris RN66]EEA06667.1 DnaJ domain-containing protein [Cryptosporidium muris RN66]|eukprot:XP_002141016.1 DnaJ domain-containing protein [Cryptosporidium muris RN66]